MIMRYLRLVGLAVLVLLLAACEGASSPAATATPAVTTVAPTPVPETIAPTISAETPTNAPETVAPTVSAVDPTNVPETAAPTVNVVDPTLVPETAAPTVNAVDPTNVPEATVAPSVVDTPLPRPAGAWTIVALGDSLTEGDGDNLEQGGYPGRLAGLVEAMRPGTQVINLGKSGWTSQQLIAEQLPAAQAARPQIALVWIGSNDLWYGNGTDEEASDLANYTANITTILRTLRTGGAQVYIALLDDQSKRPIARNPDAVGPFNADDLARMSRRVQAYNAVITAQAAAFGATTVDFYHTTIFTDPATLADDGNHPNATGYDQIAARWAAAVRPALER